MSAPPADDRRAQPVQRRAIHLVAVLHRWADAGWARSAAASWAVAHSAAVPGPADALLVPLGLADPKRAFPLALWTSVGSCLGALLAYAVGALAFANVGRPLLSLLGFGVVDLETVRALFAEHGWQAVLISCLGFFPVKLTAVAAGAFAFPLLPFSLAVLAGRSARFLAVGALIRFAGSRLTQWIERKVHRPMGQVK